MKLPKKTLDRITQIKERLYFNKPAEEKLSFRDFANKVFNTELGFRYNLAEFQFEMAEWRLNNLNDVSMILATRGIGKTDVITCLTTLYLIYKDPTTTLIIITDTATKGQRLLKQMKDIIIASPDVFNDFNSKTLLQREFRTKQNKRKEPSIFTGSLDGSLRGIHPDYVVFDDILTRENVSTNTMESVFNKYQEVKNLTNNILIIGNVCHPLDLYSKLRDTTIPRFEIFHDDIRIPDYLRPDLDQQRAERKTEADIQANYFGVLLPDETIPFFDVKIMTMDDLPEIELQMIAYYDFSMGKRDANALTIAFLYNFKVYILGYAKVCRWSDFIRDTKDILIDFNIKQVYYENNTTGDEPQDIFTGYGISSVGYTTTLNKRFKINRLIAYSSDLILVSTGNQLNRAYIDDFKNYNPSDSNCKDDAVDSATMCLMQMGYIKGKTKYE